MNNKEQEKPSSRWMEGALVLGLAAVLSKALGTLQKIPLQNLAGDQVFGIYNAVYPLYILITFLATAGFPVAVSAFVAQRASKGQYGEARRVLRISIAVLSLSGLVFFACLYWGADLLAGWIGIQDTAAAIRSVSFALLIVPVMSALRGYFQGHGSMMPTAYSQVAEQLVRVLTMVGLLLYFMHGHASEGTIAAGATFGSVTGAAAGLAVVGRYWIRERANTRVDEVKAYSDGRESTFSLVRQFMIYALPIALGSVMLPILTLVDTFTMPRLLANTLGTEAKAMHQFGLYNHGLPLVQMVAMIAASVTAAVVPLIAAARAKGDQRLIRTRIDLALRLTWLIGLAASIGMALTAEPLNIMFYTDNEGTGAVRILAFTALFSIMNIISGSILQGLGAVLIPVIGLLAACAVKLSGNYLLMPWLGIEGAAYSANAAFMLAAAINLYFLRKLTGASFRARSFLWKPGLAVAILSFGIFLSMHAAYAGLQWLPVPLPPRLQSTIVSLFSVLAAVLIYIAAVFKTGCLTKDDLTAVPKLQRKLEPFLLKMRLWKPMESLNKNDCWR